ncbi:MAG: MoxR family ATPase [Planctomycetes bacterium]|nr:MoxR family ATPase [Planctomycetota bacterium]
MPNERGAGPADAQPSPDEVALAEKLVQARDRLKEEVHKIIVGQDEVIEQLLLAIFCRGHCLMVGVPGLAKTALVNTLGKALNLHFARIQFTPDLMPSDITGTDIIQEDPESGRRKTEFLKGPIFTNLLLADEINRTPPKTQAALLEAMQERRVTVGAKTYELPAPFFVLATQNPIEQEGTYPLPEAQLDRFMFMVNVGYPTREDEINIMRRTTSAYHASMSSVFSAEELLGLQEIVRKVPLGDHVYGFAVDLVRATRVNEPGAAAEVKRWLDWGAGPRAAQYLILGAKARALLMGRFHATIDDIVALAKPVMRHRIVLNFAAESEGLTPDLIIERVLQSARGETQDKAAAPKESGAGQKP